MIIYILAFVDELIFIPCPKVNFDKQPKHEMRFYFFFWKKLERGMRSHLVY